MASRKEQKEAARQRRLAEEQAARSKSQQTRRLQVLGGGIVVAIIVVVVLVVVSTSGGNKSSKTVKAGTKGAAQVASTVNSELQGIPQSGNTLGNPNAKVTMTEFGDLECPICRDFALGAESQLINNEVRKGKVKLVYKSMLTATNDLSDASTIFPMQQSAAYAAGEQNKAWNYILLFYHEQQEEGTPYVNTSFLTGLAKQVNGLDVSKWSVQRNNPKYAQQVVSDEQESAKLGLQGTPSVSFSGPKSQTKYATVLDYSALQKLIQQVS